MLLSSLYNYTAASPQWKTVPGASRMCANTSQRIRELYGAIEQASKTSIGDSVIS